MLRAVAIVSRQRVVEPKGIVRVPLLLQSCQSRQLVTAIDALESLITTGVVDIDSIALESGSFEPTGTKLFGHFLASIPDAVSVRVIGVDADLAVGATVSVKVMGK